MILFAVKFLTSLYLQIKELNYHGKYINGTGFLIASDLVLTVAHNIYSRDS